MKHYTPQQINLFARLAEERIAREAIASATASSVGAAVGWTGKWDLLKKFAQKLQTGRTGAAAAGGASGATLQERLRALYPQGAPGRRRTRE